MRIRLLGPIEVVDEQSSLSLRGTKERALLAALALHANDVVPAGVLIDAVWGDEVGPKRARAVLHVHVANLRKVLEPHRRGDARPERLLTRAPGYVLRVSPDELDLLAFDALAKAGQEALALGRYTDAAGKLREALALWRGPPLADVTERPFFKAAIVRLEESRFAVLEDRIEADLRLGRHGELVGELESLVGELPFRERLCGQLMMSLYRSGRQAEALRAYRATRTVLVETLGIEPSPALAELDRAILRQDPELDAPAPRSPPRPGLPPPLQSPSDVAFVGRQSELELLRRCWKQAATGSRRAVVIGGAPGIGKTRLATEIALVAHAENATVLYGRCDEQLGVPFQPFIEALVPYVAEAPEEVLRAHARVHGGELARLVPALVDRVPELPAPARADAATERYRLFEAVAALVASAGRESPVLLVLDDLHWATRPTLLLLKHLLTVPCQMPLLVVGLFRDTEVGATSPTSELLADLRGEHGIDRLTLGGLSEDEVLALVEHATGEELGERGRELARAVSRESRGNPFYATELIRHLNESSMLPTTDQEVSSATLGLAIPESIREVVGRRIQRLSGEAQRVLTLAAVIGVTFDAGLLERVSARPADEALTLLEEAVSAGLVSEIPGSPEHFEFSHALVHQTIYEGLGPTRRSRLHRRTAVALEELLGEEPRSRVAELARHWFGSAQPDDVLKAISYARRAARQAVGNLAFEEAAAHYSAALAALEDRSHDVVALRCDLLLGLGDAQRRAGYRQYRDAIREAAGLARGLGDGERLAQAALATSRPNFWFTDAGHVDEEAVALYEEALEALGPEATTRRAELLAGLAAHLFFTPDLRHRLALSDEALSIARHSGDDVEVAKVLAARLICLWHPTLLDERLAAATELADLARELGDEELELQGRLFRVMSLYACGDMARAHEDLTGARQLAMRLRQPYFQWLASAIGATPALLQGPAIAEAAMAETLELGGDNPDAGILHAAQLFLVRWDQGRLGEMIEPLRDLAERVPSIPGYAAALTLAYLETGRLDECREQFRGVVTSEFERAFDYLTVATILGEVCASLPEPSRADGLYQMLVPFAQRVVVVGLSGSLGATARVLGMLAASMGDWDRAEDHFEQALLVNQRAQADTMLVRTQRAYATMLVARTRTGDDERAVALVEAALPVAEALRMTTEIHRLRALEGLSVR